MRVHDVDPAFLDVRRQRRDHRVRDHQSVPLQATEGRGYLHAGGSHSRRRSEIVGVFVADGDLDEISVLSLCLAQIHHDCLQPTKGQPINEMHNPHERLPALCGQAFDDRRALTVSPIRLALEEIPGVEHLAHGHHDLARTREGHPGV